MERGNLSGVSDSVLDALARALQLDEAESAHLLALARAAGPGGPHPTQATAQLVRPSIARVLDLMTDIPAFINNRRLDILAANPLAQALYAPLFADPTRPANHARFAFLDPRAHDFWLNWDRLADDTVAILRTEAGRDPYDKAHDRPGRRTVHAQRGLPRSAGPRMTSGCTAPASSTTTTRSSATSTSTSSRWSSPPTPA